MGPSLANFAISQTTFFLCKKKLCRITRKKKVFFEQVIQGKSWYLSYHRPTIALFICPLKAGHAGTTS